MDLRYVVFSTFGDMNFKELLNECQKDAWVPVLVINDEDPETKQKRITVPIFHFADLAIKFAKRNIERNVLWGTTSLTNDDWKKMHHEWGAKGFELKFFDYPRKFPKDKLQVEIFEYADRPDVYAHTSKGVKVYTSETNQFRKLV